MLDLVLSNSSSLIVTQNNDPIIPVNNYHPSPNINLTFSKFHPSLLFYETSYDWSNVMLSI